jgi:hypothetical protein
MRWASPRGARVSTPRGASSREKTPSSVKIWTAMLRGRCRLPPLGLPTRVLWRGGRVVANDLVKGTLIAGSAVPGQRSDRVLRVVELHHVKPGKARSSRSLLPHGGGRHT